MSKNPAEGAPQRRTRSDGERTRRAILETAVRLATIEGLERLSIGRLAEESRVSKSGLFAHFRSKEKLQLATIEAAREIFVREIIAPAEAALVPRERIEQLCERFLSYVERLVFPGGCFFAVAAAEVARDRVRFASASRSISASGCSFSNATSLRRKRLDCSMIRLLRKSRSSATPSWSQQTPRSSCTETVPHSTARAVQSAPAYVPGSRTQTPVRKKSAPLGWSSAKARRLIFAAYYRTETHGMAGSRTRTSFRTADFRTTMAFATAPIAFVVRTVP